ncbi:hypothetical protein D3P08_23660 [Paenibacillus nanensis]|uniref:DUF5626 domain-containing protein n=1 Tax=Paenibacillus nanensis TaxID=393251 RepID=A0A3A1UTK4_9BACL|nr:hypothetical protein [Paenibacillus nanensis]RIX48698.1 hypothetical protein D3P08_23660 [Paenibacillus nanensis]
MVVKVKRFSKFSLCLWLVIVVLMAPQLAAASGKKDAKTPPPPVEIQPMAIYPTYTYLKSSSIIILGNTNGSITIEATTAAKTTVSEVGVTIQLQEWTGSAWVDLIPASSNAVSNGTSVTGYLTRYSRVGYYYRVKATHYVEQGATTEQVIEYSASFLAK